MEAPKIINKVLPAAQPAIPQNPITDVQPPQDQLLAKAFSDSTVGYSSLSLSKTRGQAGQEHYGNSQNHAGSIASARASLLLMIPLVAATFEFQTAFLSQREGSTGHIDAVPDSTRSDEFMEPLVAATLEFQTAFFSQFEGSTLHIDAVSNSTHSDEYYPEVDPAEIGSVVTESPAPGINNMAYQQYLLMRDLVQASLSNQPDSNLHNETSPREFDVD